MKNLTWQNPEQLFVAQELINKVKSKCCGIKVEYLYRSPGMLYDFNDYIKQLATAEQYDRFISCLDKTVVYKAHTPKSYYAAIGNALPINSYCGLTVFVPQESLPKMLEWYQQRVSWYQAVYE